MINILANVLSFYDYLSLCICCYLLICPCVFRFIYVLFFKVCMHLLNIYSGFAFLYILYFFPIYFLYPLVCFIFQNFNFFVWQQLIFCLFNVGNAAQPLHRFRALFDSADEMGAFFTSKRPNSISRCYRKLFLLLTH